MSVVREARDARRAEERRLREREESEKKVKDALAADQLATSERERARLVRWRAALGLAVLLMAAALVTAGYFWQQAKLEGQNVIAERKALEETAVLLNSDLAAAKESLAKTEAELANVQRSLAELQVQRAAEAGGQRQPRDGRFSEGQAGVGEGEAGRDPAEDAGDARSQIRRPAGRERLETQLWWLLQGCVQRFGNSQVQRRAARQRRRGQRGVPGQRKRLCGDSVEFRHAAQDVAVRAAEPAILRSQYPGRVEARGESGILDHGHRSGLRR